MHAQSTPRQSLLHPLLKPAAASGWVVGSSPDVVAGAGTLALASERSYAAGSGAPMSGDMAKSDRDCTRGMSLRIATVRGSDIIGQSVTAAGKACVIAVTPVDSAGAACKGSRGLLSACDVLLGLKGQPRQVPFYVLCSAETHCDTMHACISVIHGNRAVHRSALYIWKAEARPTTCRGPTEWRRWRPEAWRWPRKPKEGVCSSCVSIWVARIGASCMTQERVCSWSVGWQQQPQRKWTAASPTAAGSVAFPWYKHSNLISSKGWMHSLKIATQYWLRAQGGTLEPYSREVDETGVGMRLYPCLFSQ